MVLAHIIQGDPKKMSVSVFDLKSVQDVGFDFSACFGIRISSLIHLTTLTIPIQNQKCLKTQKTHARTHMFHGEWRMGDPVSHSGFRFPTQNKLWKVKHKLEELKIAIGKDKKRRSPYKCDYIDPDVKFVSINSLFKRLVEKSFCFNPPPLASFLKNIFAF